MQKKIKNNPFMIIIVVSIILFISAITWNTLRPDFSETVFVPNIPNKIATKKPNAKPLITLDSENYRITQKIIEEKLNNPNYVMTQKEAKVHINNLETKMRMHVMYKTPEDVMVAIRYYQSINDEENINIRINFLIERFPDYNMPE